jgi:hypothetical protein
MIYREMRLIIIAIILHMVSIALMILGWMLGLKFLKIVAVPLTVIGFALTMYSIVALTIIKQDKVKK